MISEGPAKAAGDRMNGGEFEYRREDFAAIANMLNQTSGIFLPETKSALVYSRLVKRLRALGLSTFREYCALLESPSGEAEFKKMRDSLTTNVTRFFREPHHFAHLRNQLLPDLIKRARRGGKVRFWSAGCSTGQEPYSIALTILSEMPDARSYDIKVLATDISSSVIDVARRARYTAEELQDVPADARAKWIEKDGDAYIMDDAVRALVSVKALNLIEDWPMRGPFDAIFCRNVVIYFEEATQIKIWRRMLPLLSPGGALYIGHSERVNGLPPQSLSMGGVTTYVKPLRDAA